MSKPKKKNIFKSLLLDREQLSEWINQIAREAFTNYSVSNLELVGKSQNQYRCIVVGDDKEIYLDFYYNGDGTTTIQPNCGANPDVGREMAVKMLNFIQFKNSDMTSMSYSVRPLEKGDFDIIVEYLTGLEDCKLLDSNRNDTNKYHLFKFRSKIGDKLTLTYFDNQRLQLQGKPAFLYQEVTCMLASYFPFDEMVKSQAEFFSVDLSPKEIRDEMKELLPNAYASLDETLKSILSSSLALQKIDIPLEDYSCFAFPALRTLEGYLKGIFRGQGIIVGKEGFYFFDKVGGKYVLNVEKCGIKCNNVVIQCIEHLYNYYNRQRHGLFHASGIGVGSRILADKRLAETIISDVVSLIETSHNDIMRSFVN
ncbi:type II toxin-antitoxin system RnlA family toxin [Bacillus sp. BR3(2024)]|uniref:type II toxin-antitoxin system RnlA family toxin n=1 Tax=Bacillus sp. BR3(2024) TaxID=3126755 RepID=UPI0031839D09